MGEPFDLYCTASAEAFREGVVVTLDGIDGFFDQYFEAARPGQTIRFAVLVGDPSDVPHSLRELEAMPFVTARVQRCDPLGGDVEVLSRTTLGAWCRAIELSTQSPAEVQLQVSDAPLHELVVQASRNGSAYWRSGVESWLSLDETSAVGAFRDDSAVRVIVIRTSAVPALVARVHPPTT
jgi:hypothetical protein